MDVNMPRDKETGKPRGFGFLMYEDQRSTVLAVDNLNGSKVLDKTLRVDHVKNYKQPKIKGEDGEWIEPEQETFNAKPELIAGPYFYFAFIEDMQTHHNYTTDDDTASNSSASRAPSIDPEDPMRDYLLSKRKEEKMKKSKKSKSKHKDETPEERRERKQRKKEKKAQKVLSKSAAVKDVETLLSTLRERNEDSRPRGPSPDRYRKRPRSSSPDRDRGVPRSRPRHQSPSDKEYDRQDKDE